VQILFLLQTLLTITLTVPKKYDNWYTSLLVEINITDKVGIKFIPIYDTGVGCDIAAREKAEVVFADFNASNEALVD